MYKRITRPGIISLGTPFVVFSSLITLICFADAIMSYATPVFLEKHFNNTFILGLVFSFSSFVGLLFDFFASKKLKTKNFDFFISSTIFLAVIFPLILLIFPKNIFSFLLALGIWGMYYELEAFAVFNFIEMRVPKSEYSKAWGIISNLRSTSYLAGPSLATFLVSKSLNLSFLTALGIFLFTLVSFLVLSKTLSVVKNSQLQGPTKKTTAADEFKVWKILMKKVWHLWLFSFILVCVDAAFWSIGIIFAEDLKSNNEIGELFILAYMLPSTVMGFILPKIVSKIGKKRTAFISAFIGGLAWFPVAILDNIYALLAFTFVASMFTSIAYPAVSATFEDYIERIDIFGTDMIGIEQTSKSLAFIIGPIIFGGIALLAGPQAMFGYAGIFLATISVIALAIVPRKVRMPRQELASLT